MKVTTIVEMLESVAAATPDHVAVIEGESKTSYGKLLEEVYGLAQYLRGRGLRPGDRVALLLPNSLEFVTAYFGVVAAGGIVVPLNDHYRKNELSYFIEVCGVSRLITEEAHKSLCREVIEETREECQLVLSCDWELSGNPRPIGHGRGLDDPVMYQFSSGSTGTPKRIARTHRKLLYELDSLVETMGVTSQDRFIGVAPFSHVNGLMRSMMLCLRAGASLYPLRRFERLAVARLIEKERLTVFIAVPFMFGMLAKTRFKKTPDFSSLRYCISASAPMPENLNHEFHQKFGRYVRQLYGSTETGTISVNLDEHVDNSLSSVGTPIQGVEVEVFDEGGELTAAGEMGELVVRSRAAIEGYEGLEEADGQSFRRGYFFTGDLGCKDEKGLIYLLGRKKFFINKGGYKINPQEIEDLLESHPSVEEVAVVGVPTALEDETVKAVVVLRGACSEKALVDFCRGRIADFKIPSLIEFIDQLPKSPTGKIRKKMLV